MPTYFVHNSRPVIELNQVHCDEDGEVGEHRQDGVDDVDVEDASSSVFGASPFPSKKKKLSTNHPKEAKAWQREIVLTR